MKIESQKTMSWLVSTAVVIALLVVGQELLVPFIFAVLLWSVLNALTDRLAHLGFPRWLAWSASVVSIAASLYVFARILGSEAADLATQGPVYSAKLQALLTGWFGFLHLGQAFSLTNLVQRSEFTGFLGMVATSLGGVLFQIVFILIYIGFLLAEQNSLPGKLAKLTVDGHKREEGKHVIETIAQQIRSYLGVCTLLSFVMAVVTYGLLMILGVQFAGLWALVMFFLTYIPTIGMFGVLLPALMALVQFGSLEVPVIVAVSLGAVHFLLTSVIQTILLGRSLNMSALAIMLSLTFWGLVWGIAGLFLAVPIMAALAIICQHIDGLHWVDVALAGPPPKPAKKRAAPEPAIAE
ncbi:MAG TPA: AI-2E family transporter [Rhizomicrobium sp.]